MATRRGEKYVSDNPFRLIGCSSDTSLSILKQKADAAARKLRVGLIEDCALSEEFGLEGVESLGIRVRDLAKNPIETCIYRMFWYSDDMRVPDSLCSGTEVHEDSTDYLTPWLRFLVEPEGTLMSTVFSRWHETYLSGINDQELLDHIGEDGFGDEAEAWDTLLEAQDRVGAHFLARASEIAADLVERGELQRGLEIVNSILESPLDDEDEDRAIRPIVEVGNRLARRIQEATNAILPLNQMLAPESPPEVATLNSLALSIGDRHPASNNWATILGQWYDGVAVAFRTYGMALNQNDKNAEALNAILLALEHVNSSTLREILVEDETALRELIETESRNQVFNELTPINNAPTLFTLNGIGARMYGRQSVPGHAGLYYSIHFIVMLFLPVIPLGRYLVAETGVDRYQFFGRTPWTRYMKLHLGLVLGSVICLIVTINTPDKAVQVSTIETPIGLPLSDDASAAGESSMPSVDITSSELLQSPYEVEVLRENRKSRLQGELKRLSEEIDQLDRDLAGIEQTIESEELALKGLKRDLETRGKEVNSEESSPDIVDRYNEAIQRYNDELVKLKAKIAEYNRTVKKRETRRKRHNEVVDILNTEF